LAVRFDAFFGEVATGASGIRERMADYVGLKTGHGRHRAPRHPSR
jgi:hypothetical protein